MRKNSHVSHSPIRTLLLPRILAAILIIKAVDSCCDISSASADVRPTTVPTYRYRIDQKTANQVEGTIAQI